MERDTKKTELLPGTFEMLIHKTLERNAEPMRGYAITHYIKQAIRQSIIAPGSESRYVEF